MSVPIESFIPKGWRFHAADFSVEGLPGTVMLKRVSADVARWLQLNEEQRLSYPLWAYGEGSTVEEALYKACAEVMRYNQMPEVCLRKGEA